MLPKELRNPFEAERYAVDRAPRPGPRLQTLEAPALTCSRP